MPTAVATLPSNGTVAPNGSAAATSPGGGNAFREVLRTVNGVAEDQTADASVKPAPAQGLPVAANASRAADDTAAAVSTAATNVDDAAATGTAGPPFPGSSGSVPISLRAAPPIAGTQGASAKGSRTAKPVSGADPDPSAATPTPVSVVPLAQQQPIAQAEAVRAGSEGPVNDQHATGSDDATADAAAGVASKADAAAGAESKANPATGEQPPKAEVATLPVSLPAGAVTPARDQTRSVSTPEAAGKTAAPGTEATPPARSNTVPASGDQKLPSASDSADPVPTEAAAASIAALPGHPGSTSATPLPLRSRAAPDAAAPPQTDTASASPIPSPSAADATTAADRPDAVSAAKAVQKKAAGPADRPVAYIGTEAPTQPAVSTTPALAAPAASTPAASATASAAAASMAAASSPAAATPVASTPAAPTPAAPTTPAAQIAPALLTLAQTADGSRQMTLRLHPADLGTVQVQIDRSETGTARVEITVEKTGTLQALMRDQPELHRALDDAGIPAAGRTIVFHAVPASATTGGNGSASPGPNQGGFSNGGGNNSPSGGGRSGYTGNEHNGAQARSPTGKTADARTASYRVGLDIVA